MSLYQVQKFLFQLNRSPALQGAYLADRRAVLAPYDLSDDEVRALVEPDIGLLFHLGVNGQILMHFAAFHHIEWADYLQRMRDGIDAHGPVREGVYAMTGYEGRGRPRRLARSAVACGRRVGQPREPMMPLVYAGVCAAMRRGSRAGPIRPTRPPATQFYERVRQACAGGSDGGPNPTHVVVLAAEHFANFFMDNMPSFAIGMADFVRRARSRTPTWLGIDRVRVPGDRDLSRTADLGGDGDRRCGLCRGMEASTTGSWCRSTS